MKNIEIFYLKIFPFLVVKFSIYFNRNVFVMKSIPMSNYNICFDAKITKNIQNYCYITLSVLL